MQPNKLLDESVNKSINTFIVISKLISNTILQEKNEEFFKKNEKEKLGTQNADYGKQEYWEERFEEEDEYDWLCKYSDLKTHISPFINKDDRILIVGCGNSLFSTQLYDDGFENIVNIDFSSICIEKMKKNNLTRNKMEWLVMDMTDMKVFKDNSFDVVIDKATFDALMVAEENVWEPSEMCKKKMILKFRYEASRFFFI
jgi:2-polyprenyl-3-methyl-5-hydroxy-6-metoxy-1,4-benzoquinol methylase